MNTAVIARTRLLTQLKEEEARFLSTHPRSNALFEAAKNHLLGGVPMNWMVRWAGSFPIFVREADGAHIVDADGIRYLDLCLGDTGAMAGHTPPETVDAVINQVRLGSTFMLPVEDVIAVSRLLAQRFGLPLWQFTLTATDANRFAIRLARHITGRQTIVVFNGCYHGTVDETLITLQDGEPRPRRGNIGPPVNPILTTRVIEFNDGPALRAALAPGDVACVLAEPVMTNMGIIHPQPGFLAMLRDCTRQAGTLLILDETHTISAGPSGYTGLSGVRPDLFTLGKPIAGGLPAAVYGMSADVAERVNAGITLQEADVGGIGGTLAGNALSVAAMKATLENVLTEVTYAHTIALAERFVNGVEGVIEAFDLPWHVAQLGCRAEYAFCPVPPVNGTEAAAAMDPDLDRYLHLAALNRGILMTPFHCMALISPATTEVDIDFHTRVLYESVEALLQ